MPRIPHSTDRIMQLHLANIPDTAISARIGASLDYIRRTIQRERKARGLDPRVSWANTQIVQEIDRC